MEKYPIIIKKSNAKRNKKLISKRENKNKRIQTILRMEKICKRKIYKIQITWNLEILMEETLKAVKRTDNKLENRMINIEIQQNTLISMGKYSKYVKGTIGKIVEQIIFRKYLERTIKREDRKSKPR